jgi:hypothetical protein
MREVQRLFSKLDARNPDVRKSISRAMRKPMTAIKKDAKANLTAQGSIKSGDLKRGLAVGSKSAPTKGSFSSAFGGRTVYSKPVMRFATVARSRKRSKIRGNTNHFHLVNSGTKVRQTKAGHNRGSVGRDRTQYRGRNHAFRLGVADRAVRSR